MIYLETNSLLFYLLVGLGVLFVLALVITSMIIAKKKKPKTNAFDVILLVQSLGGIDNIKQPKQEHQRLKMTIIDSKKINATVLKALGIPAFLKGQELTLLIKHHTKDVLSYLSERQKEGL